MESGFWHFVQLESRADYRRPGRPKGSRDRAPRKTNAKHGAAIRHMDSSFDQQGSTALQLRPFDDERIHVLEEKEASVQMAYTGVSQHCPNCSSTARNPFLTESVQSDPFHGDWSYW